MTQSSGTAKDVVTADGAGFRHDTKERWKCQPWTAPLLCTATEMSLPTVDAKLQCCDSGDYAAGATRDLTASFLCSYGENTLPGAGMAGDVTLISSHPLQCVTEAYGSRS